MLAVAPARAEAPANDRPVDALVASPLSFAHLADYTEATATEDEPYPCWHPFAQLPERVPGEGGAQTLWYRYDVTEPLGLLARGERVVNENGYLDLGAYRVNGEDLELIGCVSSSPSSNWTDEILIRAQPGETYLFMMSMVTYPDDTTAWFLLNGLGPIDLAVRSVDVEPVAHETDVTTQSSGEEFDVVFTGTSDEPGWTIDWTLSLCPVPVTAEFERCRTFTGRIRSQANSGEWVGRQRITGVGVGDFVATVQVLPAFTADRDDSNDRLSTRFSVLTDALGFGVG
ncbi:MAG TPA: hypothetical protein VGB52_12660 [Actinomycetota bacterium]